MEVWCVIISVSVLVVESQQTNGERKLILKQHEIMLADHRFYHHIILNEMLLIVRCVRLSVTLSQFVLLFLIQGIIYGTCNVTYKLGHFNLFNFWSWLQTKSMRRKERFACNENNFIDYLVWHFLYFHAVHTKVSDFQKQPFCSHVWHWNVPTCM